MESGERDEVDGQFSEVGVELTGESETASNTRHGGGDQVVQVTVGGGRQLEGSEADVVQGFVVDHHALVGVLDQLVDGEGGVVGLHDGVGHLGGGHHGEGLHDSVGVLFSDLGDEEGAHSGAGSTAQGVGDLEALQAVAALGLLPGDVQHGVDEFGALGVVALGPVVARAGLSEHEVVGSEQLSEGACSDGVHGSGFEVHEDCSGDVAAAGGFVVVDVDPLELEVGVAVVGAGGVDAVLVGDDLPELSSDLVAALSSLNVYDLSHQFKSYKLPKSIAHQYNLPPPRPPLPPHTPNHPGRRLREGGDCYIDGRGGGGRAEGADWFWKAGGMRWGWELSVGEGGGGVRRWWQGSRRAGGYQYVYISKLLRFALSSFNSRITIKSLSQQPQSSPTHTIRYIVQQSSLSQQGRSCWAWTFGVGSWLDQLIMRWFYDILAMENNPCRLLFISKGKLLSFSQPSIISGFLRMEDSSNLITIEGVFTYGHCPSATIYSQQLYIVRNIQVMVGKKGEVLVYGNDAEKISQMGNRPIFKGSYRGYRKHGRGVYYVTQDNKDYEDLGFWTDGERQGFYAFTHMGSSEEQNTYQYCRFIDGKVSSCKRIVKITNWVIEQDHDSKNISQEEKEKIVAEQNGKVESQIRKRELQTPRSVARGLISAHPAKLRLPTQYLSKEASDWGDMLCRDFCELYLAYLARSPAHQSKSQTAIISLSTTQILQCRGTQSQREKNMRLVIERGIYMSRYSGQYSIFSPAWDRVIFPLVKNYSNCKHFLFASVEIRKTPIKFDIKLDSEYQKMLNSLRFFLLVVAQRDRPADTQLINNINKMSKQIDFKFPQQPDSVSCGVFMLQGISDLMVFGQPKFSSDNVAALKRKMVEELQSVSGS